MHNDFKESKLEAIWGSYSLLWDCRALELLISDFVSYGTYLIISAGAETNLVFINDIFFCSCLPGRSGEQSTTFSIHIRL